ncbi:MAG: hypothetical protein SPE43_05215 [Ruminococcus sp.]|nr:hypothetical protein [Ruminococcus sp.]
MRDKITMFFILVWVIILIIFHKCIIELCGYMNNDISDHIAEHGITACINCTAGEFEYYSG